MIGENENHKGRNKDAVLIYNGKKYAVGVLWFVASDEDDTSSAKARVKKAKGDFYCIRSSIVNQHGVGFLRKGHRAGMPAAASIAVDKLVGEWHGVFEAENGWWYLQVHSDTIAPHGDQFYTSEEEVYNVFMANQDRHNWPHSYAPKKWNLKTREMTLGNLLEGREDIATLQATSLISFFGSARNLQIAAASIIGLMIVGFVLTLLPQMFEKPLPPPKAVPLKAKKEVAQLPKEIKPLPELSAPDGDDIIELPKPSQVIDACGQAAALVIRPIPGWPLNSMLCNGKNVTVTWGQTVGSMNMARGYFQEFPEKARISINGRLLSASIPLTKLPLIQQDNWLTKEESIFKLEQRLNNLGSLQLKPVTPKAPQVQNKNRPPPPPPRPYIEVNLKTNVSPKKLAGYFDLPGMEITSIKWDVPNSSWEYKATLTMDRKGS